MFGREEELSLVVFSSQGEKGFHPHAMDMQDFCILKMLEDLRENFGAVEFGKNVGGADDYPDLFARHRCDPSIRNPINACEGLMLPSGDNPHRELMGSYFEMSTGLETDPFELVRRVRRNHQIAAFLCGRLAKHGWRAHCFNAVSDRKGRSCGMHDNFLVSRVLFNRIMYKRPSNVEYARGRIIQEYFPPAQDFMSWLALRIIFMGAGKAGREYPDRPGTFACGYQISERADFLMCLSHPDTSYTRPILNTRNEPHADIDRFGRLHVINGEGNRSPRALALGIGLTELILAALEDDSFRPGWHFVDPLAAVKDISRDVALTKKIPVINRKSILLEEKTALELLADIVSSVASYCGWARVPPWSSRIVGDAQDILGWLQEGDPKGKTSRMLDWKIKQKFLTRYMGRKLGLNPDHAASWDHPQIQQCDLQYHCLTNDEFWRRIALDQDVVDAEKFFEPYGKPEEPKFWMVPASEHTRSYLASYFLYHPHLRRRIVFAGWDKIVVWNESFDDARAVALDDPRKFTKRHLEHALGRNPDFSQASIRQKLFDFLVRCQRVPEEHPPPPADDSGYGLRVLDVPSAAASGTGAISLRDQGYPNSCSSGPCRDTLDPEPDGG